MKKHLIAAATLMTSVVGVAHADDGSSLQLYGILDLAVGTIEHSANASPDFPGTVNPVNKVSTKYSNSVTGMFNGGISPSRWGIKGTEDLDNGMQAFFGLESGINLQDGKISNAAASLAGSNTTQAAASAINGQLFNRGAFVGLRQTQWGSIAFGRTTTLGYDTVVNYDPMHAAQLFSPLGFSGSYAAGGITEGSRTDNNIKYTNKFDGVNFGLSYSFGGQAGDFRAGSTFGANVGYEVATFGIQATYYEARDELHAGGLVGANAATSAAIGTNVGALTLNDDDDFMIAAKYGWGPMTFKAGYERYELKAPSDPIANGSTVNYFGYTGTATNTVFTTKTNLYFAGGDYKITPALDVSVGIYDTQTVQATGVAGGNQLQYSTLVDYNLSKRTDVYLGYMFSHYNGAAFNGNERTNYILAGGMRTAF
jgi:GBP family porin